MTQNLCVKIVDVNQRFSGKVIFSAINAAVGPGECLAVTGRNGSGKSTLLKIIAGVQRPTRGEIGISADGQPVQAGDRRRFIGLVSPEIVLYNGLTGRENLDFLLKAGGCRKTADEVLGCIAAVGLAERADERVQTYSTGMRQRLKLALLLAFDYSLWLLDEPSSNLDAEGKELVAALIQSALKRGTTIILATNEATEARYAGQIVELA